jgi:hypothetical protein
MAQILFTLSRSRKDIHTTISFLATRVRDPDGDDWGRRGKNEEITKIQQRNNIYVSDPQGGQSQHRQLCTMTATNLQRGGDVIGGDIIGERLNHRYVKETKYQYEEFHIGGTGWCRRHNSINDVDLLLL